MHIVIDKETGEPRLPHHIAPSKMAKVKKADGKLAKEVVKEMKKKEKEEEKAETPKKKAAPKKKVAAKKTKKETK
jgi:hypothetical protein